MGVFDDPVLDDPVADDPVLDEPAGSTPADLGPAAHEQVVFCQDPASGLRAIIAIFSTALGPAVGGTRFAPYASEDDALADVKRLSRAMA